MSHTTIASTPRITSAETAAIRFAAGSARGVTPSASSSSIASNTRRVNPGPARTSRYCRPLASRSRAAYSSLYSSAPPPPPAPTGATVSIAARHSGVPGPARSASVRSWSCELSKSRSVTTFVLPRRHEGTKSPSWSRPVLRVFVASWQKPLLFHRRIELRANHLRQLPQAVKHARAQRDCLGPGDRFHLRIGKVLEHAQDDHFLLVGREVLKGFEDASDFFLLLDVVGGAGGDVVRCAGAFDALDVQLRHVAHGAALATARVVARKIPRDRK